MEQRLNAEEFCIDKDFVFIVGTVVSFGFLGFEGLHSVQCPLEASKRCIRYQEYSSHH